MNLGSFCVHSMSAHISSKIAQRTGIAPNALSYHLKLLKSADLVLEYKEKNFIYYEVNTSVFQELILWVSQFVGK